MNKHSKYYPCFVCWGEPDCAANDWCLYDPYNKKCPNWLDGVNDTKRIFIKDLQKGDGL